MGAIVRAKFFPIILLSLFTWFMSCTSSQPKSIDDPTEPITHEPTGNNEKPEEKTALFAILAPDIMTQKRYFNRWDSFKKTKGRVHIFADPARKEVFDGFLGIKHFVPQTDLVNEMQSALSTTQANRLMIFIDTHGSSVNGNFCYPNNLNCSLTEDFLVEFIRSEPAQKLEQILIVTGSCHQRRAMTRFATKLKNSDEKPSISFIQQKSDDVCTSGDLPAKILNNQIELPKNLPDESIDELLSISTLDEIINFHNKFLANWRSHFELIHLKPGEQIDLNKFGFNFRLDKLLFKAPFGSFQPFPFNETPSQLLSNLSLAIKFYPLATKFYPHIQALVFHIKIDESSGRAYEVPVNGKISEPILENSLRGKEYSEIDVLLTKNPDEN